MAMNKEGWIKRRERYGETGNSNEELRRERISKSGVGHIVTSKTREKISISNKKFAEDHPEWCEEISKRNKRYAKEHPEWVEEISKRNTGMIVSEEARRKMSEAKKGVTLEMQYGEEKAFEIRRKRSNTMMGKNYGTQPVVHHINGDHNDDRPENKEGMIRSDHLRLHHKQGDYPNNGRLLGSKNII